VPVAAMLLGLVVAIAGCMEKGSQEMMSDSMSAPMKESSMQNEGMMQEGEKSGMSAPMEENAMQNEGMMQEGEKSGMSGAMK